MKELELASRYAKALFEQGKEQIEALKNDLEWLLKIFKEYPDLLKLLKTPQISLQEKQALMQESLKDHLSPLFFSFLNTLIEKARLHLLWPISLEFRSLANRSLNIWEVTMRTAVPLDPEIEHQLTDRLAHTFHKTIQLNKEIDPHMIGGAILLIGNLMIDWSVRGRLTKMKEALLSENLEEPHDI